MFSVSFGWFLYYVSYRIYDVQNDKKEHWKTVIIPFYFIHSHKIHYIAHWIRKIRIFPIIYIDVFIQIRITSNVTYIKLDPRIVIQINLHTIWFTTTTLRRWEYVCVYIYSVECSGFVFAWSGSKCVLASVCVCACVYLLWCSLAKVCCIEMEFMPSKRK